MDTVGLLLLSMEAIMGIKTIAAQLQAAGRLVRAHPSEGAMWGVWGDLVEVGADLSVYFEEVDAVGPWQRWCREQAEAARLRLKGMERVSWSELGRVYESFYLAWSPKQGRHVPKLRERARLLYGEEAAQIMLSKRLGVSRGALVRWMGGERAPRLERRVTDWLERGEQAFPAELHPELVERRERARARGGRPKSAAEGQLDLLGAA